ncbi:hypothetical protein CLCR_07663 [Cladophialophora carrionii]|uniref:Uncharacterized protein n=1 Tax=Cladophialophora carrionii TaxID=86049 RepID=A0A1C1CLV3_9EURO|nr:hypothetical protein CLCR_07663 [Cladophialophora carrionii]
MSSNPAKYAQLRRDAEHGTRQELQLLIPERYIDDVPECEPRDNPMTKAVKASVAYIKDIVRDHDASTNSNNQPSSVFTPNRTELRLKPVMERVKQHIQGRGHDGEELSDEVKRMMDEATDTLVNIIDNWEGRGQQPQG